MQCIRVVANDIEAAALHRPFGAERRDDDIATRLYRSRDLTYVGRPMARVGQEMKSRTVVPDVVCVLGERKGRDVAAQPVDTIGRLAETLPRNVECGARDIQDRQIVLSAGEEVIDQLGFAPADIDDARFVVGRPRGDKIERNLEVRTVPADFVGPLRAIDFLPMRGRSHSPISPS